MATLSFAAGASAQECPNALSSHSVLASDPTVQDLFCAPPCAVCTLPSGFDFVGPFVVRGTSNLSNGETAQFSIDPNVSLIGALPTDPCEGNDQLVGIYFVWTWPVVLPGCGLAIDVGVTLELLGDQVYFDFQAPQNLSRCVSLTTPAIPFTRDTCGEPLLPDACAPRPVGGPQQDAYGWFVQMPRMGRPNSAWWSILDALNVGDPATAPEFQIQVTLPDGATALTVGTTSTLYFVTAPQPQWGDLMLVGPAANSGEIGENERGLMFRNGNDDSGVAGVTDSLELDDKFQRPGAIPDVLFDQVMMGTDPILTADFPYLTYLDPQLMAVVIDMGCNWGDLDAVRVTASGAGIEPVRFWLAFDFDDDEVYDALLPQTNPLEFDLNANPSIFCALVGQPDVEQDPELCATKSGWGQPVGLFMEALAPLENEITLALEGQQGGAWATFDQVTLDVLGMDFSVGDDGSAAFVLPTLQGIEMPVLGEVEACDNWDWDVAALSMRQFAHLQQCFGSAADASSECTASDFNCDGVVDGSDFMAFCESPSAQPCDIGSRLLAVTVNIPVSIIELRSNPILGLLAPPNMQWVVRRPDASGSPLDPRFVSITSFPSADLEDPTGSPWPGFELVDKSYFKLHVVVGMDTSAWYSASGILSNLYLAHAPSSGQDDSLRSDIAVTALLGMCGPITVGSSSKCNGTCCRTDDPCCDEDASPCLTCELAGEGAAKGGSGPAKWKSALTVFFNDTETEIDDFVPRTSPATSNRPYRHLNISNESAFPVEVTVHSKGNGFVSFDPMDVTLPPQGSTTVKVYGEQASASENSTKIEVRSGGTTCATEDVTVVSGVKIRFAGTFMFMVDNNRGVFPTDPFDCVPADCDNQLLWQATPLPAEGLEKFYQVYVEEGAPIKARWPLSSQKRPAIGLTVTGIKTFGPTVNLNNRDPAIKSGVAVKGIGLDHFGEPGVMGYWITDDCDNNVFTPPCGFFACPSGDSIALQCAYGKDDGVEPLLNFGLSIGDAARINYKAGLWNARIWTRFPPPPTQQQYAEMVAQDLADVADIFFPNWRSDQGAVSPNMTYIDGGGVLQCQQPLSVFQLLVKLAGFRSRVRLAWANWTSRHLALELGPQGNSSFIATLMRDIAHGHPVNMNPEAFFHHDAECFMQFSNYDWYTHMGVVSKGVVSTPDGIAANPEFVEWLAIPSDGCPIPSQPPASAKGADPY